MLRLIFRPLNTSKSLSGSFVQSRTFATSRIAAMASNSRINNPALFICDIQEKFRGAIYEFPKVVSTSAKMVKAANILNIPIYATTQNAARLGATVSELQSLIPTNGHYFEQDKTAFSMMVPDLKVALSSQTSGPLSVIIVGIETHICVSQTALDLLSMGHRVYVLADGVSSCNAGERPVALERLRSAGCTITTSEGIMFELVGDASSGSFKAIAGLVKDTKDETRAAVETFCKL